MISRTGGKFCTARSLLRQRFGTLVATEEFPFNAELKGLKPVPAVIKSSTLSSGIKLISRETNSSVVSLKFGVLGGSRTEKIGQKGAAHLLSTAAYEGTSNATGLQIVRYLEGYGASFKAYSNKEMVVYDLKVLPDKVESIVACVMAAIASPPYANHVLEELKPKTQLYYNNFAVNKSAQLMELIEEAAYGEASPLGSSKFAGNLAKLTIPEVLAYRQTHFVRGNIVVSANGISSEILGPILDKYAAGISEGPAVSFAPSPYIGGDVRVRTDADGIAHAAIAFPVPSGENGKSYSVLAAYMNSVFSTNGVCAKSFETNFSDGGLFGFETFGSATEVARILESTVNLLKETAATTPNVDSSKQKATLNNLLALEGSDTSGSLMRSSIMGSSPEGMADVRSVQGSDVSNAAKAALSSTPSYAVLGATTGTPSFASVMKMLK